MRDDEASGASVSGQETFSYAKFHSLRPHWPVLFHATVKLCATSPLGILLT